MPYQVRWQLVGRSERPLDSGHITEAFEGYGDAARAINEFLRPYPEVQHCADEGYWLARRSQDADLAVGSGSSGTMIQSRLTGIR